MKLQEDLIQSLRECLIHPSTVVRVATAPLLEVNHCFDSLQYSSEVFFDRMPRSTVHCHSERNTVISHDVLQ